jgi:hypothetical protein
LRREEISDKSESIICDKSGNEINKFELNCLANKKKTDRQTDSEVIFKFRYFLSYFTFLFFQNFRIFQRIRSARRNIDGLISHLDGKFHLFLFKIQVALTSVDC